VQSLLLAVLFLLLGVKNHLLGVKTLLFAVKRHAPLQIVQNLLDRQLRAHAVLSPLQLAVNCAPQILAQGEAPDSPKVAVKRANLRWRRQPCGGLPGVTVPGGTSRWRGRPCGAAP
jgi:uncharacterized integral membrane protein